MKKKYILPVALLLAGATLANAETSAPILFNFGASSTSGWVQFTQESGANFSFQNEGVTIALTGSAGGNYKASNFNATDTTSLSSSVTQGFSELFGNSIVFDDTVFNTGLVNGARTGGTLTISGLQASQAYSFYYIFGSKKSDLSSQTCFGFDFTNLTSIGNASISYAIGDGDFSALDLNTSTAIKVAQNTLVTVKVENVVADSSGNLTVGTMSGERGSINAFAIVAVPEPSAFGLLAGLGALALVGMRRRRR